MLREKYKYYRLHSLLKNRPDLSYKRRLGLAGHVWSVTEYVCHPVHISNLRLQNRQKTLRKISESALEAQERKKALPIP